MSVVLDRPYTNQTQTADTPVFLRPKNPVEPALQPSAQPIYRPLDVPVTTPARVKAKPATRVEHLILKKVKLFAGTFVLTYVVSALAGHCLAEKSRVQDNQALKRADYAVRAERGTLGQLNMLHGSSSVERWAFRNRFHPADGLGETSTHQDLVATSR